MSAPIVCQPCQDSPLSMVGNVVGIITFVYVLTVGVIYRISVVRRAAVELDTLQLEATFLIYKFRLLKSKVADKFMFIPSTTQSQAQIAHDAVIDEMKTLDEMLERLSHSSNDIIKAKTRNVFLGFRYIVWRDELKERLQKLNVWTERFQRFADNRSNRGTREPRLRDIRDVVEKLQTAIDQ